jgi:hypothetical protein
MSISFSHRKIMKKAGENNQHRKHQSQRNNIEIEQQAAA